MEEIRTGVIFFVGCFALFIFYLSGIPTEDSSTPKVSLVYTPNIDRFLCTPYGKRKITPDWGREMARRFPRFEYAWNSLGPTLLSKTSETIGRNFFFNEKKALLFMCPTLSEFPVPLMIPIAPFVQELNSKVSESILVDSIFHQVLHMYIVGALFPNLYTAKIKKHFHESWTTLLHLHVYALQKSVYLNTNQQFLWFQLKDRTKDPDLKRAIDIVETEGTQPFIEELR